MKRSDYIPNPADTSAVTLPPELLDLAEQLSRNVHEVWAQHRVEEGWTLGPERNDSKRETPCLVPYDELPDEEKAYDLNTAMQTLKYIKYLGFEIIPPKNS